jgi:hypothetical protein
MKTLWKPSIRRVLDEWNSHGEWWGKITFATDEDGDARLFFHHKHPVHTNGEWWQSAVSNPKLYDNDKPTRWHSLAVAKGCKL